MATIYKSKQGRKFRIVEITLGDGRKEYEIQQQDKFWEGLWVNIKENPIIILALFALFPFVIAIGVSGRWERLADDKMDSLISAKNQVEKILEQDAEEHGEEQIAEKKERDNREVRRKTI